MESGSVMIFWTQKNKKIFFYTYYNNFIKINPFTLSAVEVYKESGVRSSSIDLTASLLYCIKLITLILGSLFNFLTRVCYISS